MKSFPFDSEVTYTETGEPVYDRASNSQELRDYFHLMYTDGVFPNPSTGLQVVAYSEEMSVSVLPGNVIIRGAFGIEESTRTLVFEAAGTAYDRIDAVVARLNTNYNYRKIDLYVVKGVESASPVAPELTREGGIYELRLANVFISKNTTTITTERITDTRLNTDDCGIVTANPKVVDTTAIFDQYQASLDKYLKYVKECIDGTTAANLQNQIDEVNSNLSELQSVDITPVSSNYAAVNTSYTYAYIKNGICYLQIVINGKASYSGWANIAKLPINLDTGGKELYFPAIDFSAQKAHSVVRVAGDGKVYCAPESGATLYANVSFPCK